MIQGVANANELQNIDSVSIENGLDIGASAVDAAGKFGHSDSARVENRFDKSPNMNVLLRGHCCRFWMTVKKAWKS